MATETKADDNPRRGDIVRACKHVLVAIANGGHHGTLNWYRVTGSPPLWIALCNACEVLVTNPDEIGNLTHGEFTLGEDAGKTDGPS